MKIFKCPNEKCDFVILRQHHSNPQLWEHTRGYMAQTPGGICDKCGTNYDLDKKFSQNMIMSVDSGKCRVDYDKGIAFDDEEVVVLGVIPGMPDIMEVAGASDETVVIKKPVQKKQKPKAKPKKANKGAKKAAGYKSKFKESEVSADVVEDTEGNGEQETADGDGDES